MKYIVAFLIEKTGGISLVVAGSWMMHAVVMKAIPAFVLENLTLLAIWAWMGPVIAGIMITAGLYVLLRNQIRAFVRKLERREI